MMRLITDEMIEDALRTLATTAEKTAAARATRLRAEFRRKQVRAKLIIESGQRSVELRASEAECHPHYILACEEEARVAEIDERLRAERNDAAITIEAWRTENASNRAGSNFR